MALGTLTYIAEKVNKGDLKALNERMLALFGNTYEEFKSFENVDRPFKITDKLKNRSRKDIIYTSKYALYNDLLLGKMDLNVTMEMKDGYKTRARQMKNLAKKGGRFAYLTVCIACATCFP